jgi:hypothetical protein
MDEYNLNGFNIDWGKYKTSSTSKFIYLALFVHIEYPNDPNGVSCNQK